MRIYLCEYIRICSSYPLKSTKKVNNLNCKENKKQSASIQTLSKPNNKVSFTYLAWHAVLSTIPSLLIPS